MADIKLMWGHVGLILGLYWGWLGLFGRHVGQFLGQRFRAKKLLIFSAKKKGLKWPTLSYNVGPCWAHIGPCWAWLGLFGGHVGQFLGQRFRAKNHLQFLARKKNAWNGWHWATVGPCWVCSCFEIALGQQQLPHASWSNSTVKLNPGSNET